MKKASLLAVIFVVLCVLVGTGIYLTRNIGKSQKVISQESADKKLEKMVKHIRPEEGSPRKSPVEYNTDENVADELPDIDSCEVTVKADTDFYAEIFCSPEKAGKGTDGWLAEMAEEFNRSGVKVGGKPASIQIRNVNSGQAMDYISSGKAVPDAFSPSAMFWADMLAAQDVKTTVISERLVGNVAGILLSNKDYDKIKKEYGGVDIKAITEAVEAGKLSFGYTNPFASTSGMNYLISTLLRYDMDDPLSEKAVAGFQAFQKNVPLVSLTTMQMRNAASKGSLDGFILEYQTYVNDKTMKSRYKFTPYGFRHDNPLVMIGDAGKEKQELLTRFAEFCAGKEGQKKASEYGFNGQDKYRCDYPAVDGDILLSARQLYKENKDNGREIIAVFVADVSGSMDGEPIQALKDSLINSMKYINEDNYIGLVSYNEDVTIDLPVGQFDLNQQSLYKGAVEDLTAFGATATYDGVCVAMHMIRQEMKNHPDAKPMIFVLSDGDTNEGYSYNDVHDVIDSLNIPVYTIGYNYTNGSLEELSAINEAASINADTDDIVYQLKQLFNANM